MTKKIGRKQIDNLAESLHLAISFTALSLYYSIQHAQDEKLDTAVREKNIQIITGIIETSNTLYEELSPKQKKLLRQEAKSFLQLAGVL